MHHVFIVVFQRCKNLVSYQRMNKSNGMNPLLPLNNPFLLPGWSRSQSVISMSGGSSSGKTHDICSAAKFLSERKR